MIKKKINKILDRISPWCPSGMNHRVMTGTVINVYGHEYCWHDDCMRANFAEIEEMDKIEEEKRIEKLADIIISRMKKEQENSERRTDSV